MQKLLKTLEFNKIIEMLVKEAVTSPGKELCESLVPAFEIYEIKNSLKETEEAVNIILRYSAPNFSGIHDIRQIVRRSKVNSVLLPSELLNIADTLRGSKTLKRLSDSFEESFLILSEYFNNLYTNTIIENEICKCIDGSEKISDHASSALSKIRNQIKSEENNIKEKINSIIRGNSYSKYLQENIVTIRNGRYVIPVKQEFRSYVPGLVHDSSSTGSTLFIEPMTVVNANNKIHELYIQEKIEIDKILLDLSMKVWTISDELENMIYNLSKLDFFFAKAKLAISMSGFAPKLNDYGYINLKNARHPLIQKNTVVPINVYIGDGFNTLIITGPNTGGKTVTLKTVGLLSLMSYSGLFIPAGESSEIAVFGNIFADIGDEQSIEQSLSTFSSHMTNIIQIINSIDSNSLVLLDELGSGTDPVEGSALAISILEYLYKKGCKTFASTHYSELKTYALTTSGVKNASCEFDVDTLSPTYRLLIGLPGKSNAFAISKKLGLPEEILKNAESTVATEQVKFEDVISALQKDKVQIEKEKEVASNYLKEIESLRKELSDNKEKLDKYKKQIIENARAEATDILLSAEETAKETIKEIKDAKHLKFVEMNKKFDKTRQKIKKQLSKTYKRAENSEEYTPFDIKIGRPVYITSLEQEGSVLSLPDSEGNLFVQAGIIKSKVNVTKLRPIEKEANTLNNAKISIKSKMVAASISPEISLRHLHVEEAIYELERYIDNALIANLNTVRIVHGKGEGILRKAVHEYLKNSPHVKNYRLGNYGEGDLGVTIAELQ